VQRKRREDIRVFDRLRGIIPTISILRGQHMFSSALGYRPWVLIRSAYIGQPRDAGVVKNFTVPIFTEVAYPLGWQITDKHGATDAEPAPPPAGQRGRCGHVATHRRRRCRNPVPSPRCGRSDLSVDITDLPAVVDMKQAVQDGGTQGA